MCAVIDDYLKYFDSLSDPDEIMSTVQAQPSLYRVLLDTKTSNNYHHLRAKAFGHAVLRTISTNPLFTTEEGPITARLRQLYPDSPNIDYQTALGLLCPDQTQYWLQLRLAEFDLALQIIAPSIYMDPLKLGAITGKVTSVIP